MIGALTVVILCSVVSTNGQETLFKVVDLPGLGRVRGMHASTSQEQEPYYTFHGIRKFLYFSSEQINDP